MTENLELFKRLQKVYADIWRKKMRKLLQEEEALECQQQQSGTTKSGNRATPN